MDAGSRDPERFWSSFDRDPRVAANQALRVGDRDRDVVRDLVAEAYADGMLRQEEMDERLTRAQDATVLGDLMPIVTDLVPERATGSTSALARAGQEEIDRLALVRYRERRGQALIGMLVPSVICLAIWLFSSGGLGFPWPIFVILGTGGYFFRLLAGKESAIEEERERLRKKRARALAGDGEPLALEADEPGDDDDRRDRRDRRQDRDRWR